MKWRLRLQSIRLAAMMGIGAFCGSSIPMVGDSREFAGHHLGATVAGAMGGLVAELCFRETMKSRNPGWIESIVFVLSAVVLVAVVQIAVFAIVQIVVH
jgi:hypothetical protein